MIQFFKIIKLLGIELNWTSKMAEHVGDKFELEIFRPAVNY